MGEAPTGPYGLREIRGAEGWSWWLVDGKGDRVVASENKALLVKIGTVLEAHNALLVACKEAQRLCRHVSRGLCLLRDGGGIGPDDIVAMILRLEEFGSREIPGDGIAKAKGVGSH